MFTGINIELVGPICNCEVENLEWEFVIWKIKDVEGEEIEDVGLSIHCGTCSTELAIPPNELAATFSLEVPYPEMTEIEAPTRKKNKDDRKVIPLFEKRNKSE